MGKFTFLSLFFFAFFLSFLLVFSSLALFLGQRFLVVLEQFKNEIVSFLIENVFSFGQFFLFITVSCSSLQHQMAIRNKMANQLTMRAKQRKILIFERNKESTLSLLTSFLQRFCNININKDTSKIPKITLKSCLMCFYMNTNPHKNLKKDDIIIVHHGKS